LLLNVGIRGSVENNGAGWVRFLGRSRERVVVVDCSVLDDGKATQNLFGLLWKSENEMVGRVAGGLEDAGKA